MTTTFELTPEQRAAEAICSMARTCQRLNIATYGRIGFEVQRNNMCAYVANSADWWTNYLRAVAWAEKHPGAAA